MATLLSFVLGVPHIGHTLTLRQSLAPRGYPEMGQKVGQVNRPEDQRQGGSNRPENPVR